MAICAEIARGTKTIPVKDREHLFAILDLPVVREKIPVVRENTAQESNARKVGLTMKAKECKGVAGAAKSALPGIVFQCSTFKVHNWTDKRGVDHGDGEWRHQEQGVLNGLFMVDIDHVDDPDALWKELLGKGLMDWRPFYAFKTPSGHGLKIVMPTDVKRGNLASNQAAFAKHFDVAIDDKTIDASRLSFVSLREDVYLITDELFTYENEEFKHKYQDAYADGSSEQDLFDSRKEEGFSRSEECGERSENGFSRSEECGERSENTQKADGEPTVEEWVKRQVALIREGKELEDIDELEKKTYKGVKVYDLINGYFNGEPPKDGERHDTLLKFAADLRHIVERIPKAVFYYTLRMPWVQDLLKEGDPVVDTIHDALGFKYTSFLPKRFSDALKEANRSKVEGLDAEISEDLILKRFSDFGERFEEMFKTYPCMKEACEGYRVPSYPAIIFATACLYGTLATRAWWFHYHEPLYMRRLNYEIFIIADPASGKSGIGNLYKLILSPIISHDKVYNEATNNYKKSRRQRETSTKEMKKEPLVYPESKVRIHGPRTANNVFIEDMVNNIEDVDGTPLHLHLFTFSAELDSVALASKGGQWIDKSMFELLAFHNEEDNQQYRNVDAVTGPFDVYWNFIYTGTPFSLYRKVTKANFGSGLSTRLAVIPLCAEKFKMLDYNKTTTRQQAARETLKEWAYNIDKVKGELKIEPLVKLVYKWTADLMSVAAQTEDEGLAFLIKRVSYYGINVALPFIIMRHWQVFNQTHELPIDQKDKDLVLLIMEVQLFSQKIYFGKFTEHYFEERSTDVSEKAPSTIDTKPHRQLAMLPETFTYKDIENMLGITSSYARVLVSRWMAEGFLVKEVNAKRTSSFTKKQ